MSTVGLDEEEKQAVERAKQKPPQPWVYDGREQQYPDRVIQWGHKPTGVVVYIKNQGGGTYQPYIDDSEAKFEVPDVAHKHLSQQYDDLGAALGETIQWIIDADVPALDG